MKQKRSRFWISWEASQSKVSTGKTQQKKQYPWDSLSKTKQKYLFRIRYQTINPIEKIQNLK